MNLLFQNVVFMMDCEERRKKTIFQVENRNKDVSKTHPDPHSRVNPRALFSNPLEPDEEFVWLWFALNCLKLWKYQLKTLKIASDR